MSEVIEFLQVYWPQLVSGIVAICTAVAGVIALIQTKKFSRYLDAAKQRETYIECPRCKKKIPLSEINFHLPSGEVDNNLNGRPDSQE